MYKSIPKEADLIKQIKSFTKGIKCQFVDIEKERFIIEIYKFKERKNELC